MPNSFCRGSKCPQLLCIPLLSAIERFDRITMPISRNDIIPIGKQKCNILIHSETEKLE